MKSIVRQDMHSALRELFGEEIPPSLRELRARRDSAENVMKELLTATSPEVHEALTAFYEFHQEEVRFLMAICEELIRRR
ncbi:MAG: hypothetical protein AB1758_16085 [Candidatus Eremiobacterota bacterium]